MKLLKEVVKKDGKTYTNYYLVPKINDKNYKVPIIPKTFGRDWTHPAVRQSFTILDLVSELIVKDDSNNDKQ